MACSGSGDDYIGCLAGHLRAEELRETSGVGLTNRLERFRVKTCGRERLASICDGRVRLNSSRGLREPRPISLGERRPRKRK
jgi:hypothetical protein